MKKKKEHHDEHVDETWLIPYSDMLTLLLALFIVMFSISQVDQQKAKQLSAQFNAIFAGGSAMMESDGNSVIPMENAGSGEGTDTAAAEENTMSEIKKLLDEKIEQDGYSGKVQVDLSNSGLDITIQDTVLFNSGEAEVVQDVYPLLNQISGMLQNLNNEIKIVGHTDSVPINNGKYRSNWDLSATRAINVMTFMVTSGGLSQKNVSVQAYADQKPKFDNSTEEGKAKNRRVEIIVARNYPKTGESNK